MLKTITSLAVTKPNCIRISNKKANTDAGSSIYSGRIDIKITNLSSSTKEMIFKIDFFTFEVSFTFA